MPLYSFLLIKYNISLYQYYNKDKYYLVLFHQIHK